MTTPPLVVDPAPNPSSVRVAFDPLVRNAVATASARPTPRVPRERPYGSQRRQLHATIVEHVREPRDARRAPFSPPPPVGAAAASARRRRGAHPKHARRGGRREPPHARDEGYEPECGARLERGRWGVPATHRSSAIHACSAASGALDAAVSATQPQSFAAFVGRTPRGRVARVGEGDGRRRRRRARGARVRVGIVGRFATRGWRRGRRWRRSKRRSRTAGACFGGSRRTAGGRGRGRGRARTCRGHAT